MSPPTKRFLAILRSLQQDELLPLVMLRIIRKPLFWLIVLLATTFALYGRALTFGYVFDDHYEIPGVAKLWANGTFGRLLVEPYWKVLGVAKGSYFRPVTLSTYLFDILPGSNHPGWSHSINLLVHILNILLGYQIVRKLSGSSWISLIAVALWAVHPINVEAVSWVSARDTLLVHFFFLLALIARPNKWLMVLSMILAVGSKEVGFFLLLTVPLWIGMDPSLLRDKKNKFMIGTCLFIGVLAALRILLVPMGHHSNPVGTFVSNLGQLGNFSLSSLGRILNSWGMFEKCVSQIAKPSFLSWLIVSFLGLSIVVAVIRPNFCRKYGIGLALFFFSILPFALFQDELKTLDDRYLYTASFGILIVFAGALNEWGRHVRREVVCALAGVVFIFWSFQTFYRIGMWKNDLSLFTTMVEEDRNSYFGNIGLGLLKANQNDLAGATSHFKQVFKCSPNDYRANFYLAQISAQRKDSAAALSYLKAGGADNIMYYETCAKVMLLLKRGAAALQCSRRLLLELPDNVKSWAYQGSALEMLGRENEARQSFDRALQIDPNDREVIFAAAYFFKTTRNYGRAASLLERFREKESNETVENDLALLYLIQGDRERAREIFVSAIRVYPTSKLLMENFRRHFSREK